jgi:glycosyltransferase involved in cell wall biosynthesis
MSSEPLVSIGMPVFNGGEYLARAVRSVLAQSYPNVELVLVDDGSTDGCVESLPADLRTEPRLRIVRQENQGVLKAVDATIRESRGEFYWLCAQDDCAHPRLVEYCLWALDKNLADACFFFAHRISGNGTVAYDDLGPFDEIKSVVYSARERLEDPRRYAKSFVKLQNDGWGHFTRMSLVREVQRVWPNYDSSAYRVHLLMKKAKAIVQTSALLYYYNVGNAGSLSKKPMPERVIRFFHDDFANLYRLFEEERRDPRLKVLWKTALRWQIQKGVKMVFNSVRRKNGALPREMRLAARRALADLLCDLSDKGCLSFLSVGVGRSLKYRLYRFFS